MGTAFEKYVRTCRMGLLAVFMCLTSGCSSSLADSQGLRASFLWGPVTQDLGAAPPPATAAFSPESKAAALREELLAPVNRYAPGDKDWRVVRGTDKGPTIFGVRLSFDLSNGGSQLRLGAVRRGANHTYGPQLIFKFNGENG